jgi:ATP-binding cassette, subfamily B, bacterial
MSTFIEKLPSAIDDKVRAAKGADEEVLIQVATDMAGKDRFEKRWLVVTPARLLFLEPNGSDGDVQMSMQSVKTARVEVLVGGGRLEVERQQGAPTQLYYSNSLAPKFAEVAEGIRLLVEGEDPNLPLDLDRTHCAQCERLLPEKGGICPACIKKTDTLKRLLSYMMPYKSKALVLVALTLFTALLELAPPYIIKYIIDDVLTQRQNIGQLGLFVGVLLGINIIMWISNVARRWLNTWVGFRAIEDLRADLFRALQFLPLRFYDKRKIGSLISRMNNDSDMVEGYLIFDAPFILSNAVMVVGILGLLFYMNWELALYVLLPVPPIILGSSLIWSRLQGYWRRWSARWSRLSTHLNESIAGIRVVKAFAQETRESDRFDKRNHALRNISVSAERSWLVFFMVTNFFMSFGAFFVWYFGGVQILEGQLKLGALMAFISYLWMLYQPLKWFGDFYSFMVRAFAGAERIFEVIDARSEPFDDPNAVPMPTIKGHVHFKKAAFAYDPGKIVLRDVDLEVQPGEMIGLVGKSGVGKSTLINLITRFYDTSRGRVEIDGVDIREIRLEDLRSQIGLVAQQSFLFNGTISENIAYGKPNASFDDILRAAYAANAHEFIVKKADGYDMVVGEQGNKLSGGEKQRIAIARAILHDPKILILDEATSSLDTPTEKKIQEAIARLVAGRTTFAIAHRLSTLRSASRLVVLDAGKIAEIGTHEELMERRGIFYNLVQTQQETSAVMATKG